MKSIRWGALLALLGVASVALAASEMRRQVAGGGGVGTVATTHRLLSTAGQGVVAKVTATGHALYAGFWTPNAGTTDAPAVEPDLPAAFLLHSAYPNPARGALSLRYDVPRAGGRVSVRVYDVRGRLVRTLLDAEQGAGRRELTWDGRDDAGHAAGAGVFIVKMLAPGYRGSRKVITLP